MSSQITPSALSFAQIVKSFAPGWPAVVMGTGAFALASLNFSQQLPMLGGLAWALHWFNLVLFALISIPWFLRWVVAWHSVADSFRHPVAANFYPSYSIAVLVLAAQLHVFGAHDTLALVAWWLGVSLMFALTLTVLIAVFQGEHVNLDHVTPGVFMPPVGLVVIPVAGAPLMTVQPEMLRDLALTINGISLGAGIFMYMGLLALALHRFYIHKRLPPTLVPTFWINLAPLGVTVVSVLNLVAVTPFAGSVSVYVMAVFLLWGFGAFWLLLALLFTLTAWKIAPLPFSLTWWAFTFPLGAFTLGSQRLSEVTGLSTPLAFGWLAWVLLAAIWTLTLIKTIRGVVSGQLFQPQP